MVRIAVQLYTLRALRASPADLVARVAETAFEGVEFAGLGDAPASEVAQALEATDLAPAGAHVGIDRLEEAPEDAARRYATLGCETLVVPYLDPEWFEDEATVREAAGRLNAVAETLEWDVRLCYHNHDHEFAPLAGTLAFDVLVEALDESVAVELDVGWVTAAGHDPVDVLGRLDGRVSLLHLKDVDADGTPVELGDGIVDREACVRAAVDAGVGWLVYEHDDPDDPTRSLAHGAEVLASLRDEVGR